MKKYLVIILAIGLTSCNEKMKTVDKDGYTILEAYYKKQLDSCRDECFKLGDSISTINLRIKIHETFKNDKVY